MQILTARGSGGIAVVVADTAADRARLLACLQSSTGGALVVQPGAAPCRAQLHWGGVLRDDVLVVDRGSRGLEVCLHGSPALVRALEQEVGELQILVPSPAEALLQAALSLAQMRLALEQRAMDFEQFCADVAAMPTLQRTAALTAALERTVVATALRTPQRVVLVGRQNAGKSTLFNRLLFLERATTGPLPGLTRDAVAEVTGLSEYPYEVVDTAGEGLAVDRVDVAALARSRAERVGLMILVVDGSAAWQEIDHQLARRAVLVVATHADRGKPSGTAGGRVDFAVDARDPAQAPAIRAVVGELLRRRRGLPVAGPVGGPAALDAAQVELLRRLASAMGPRSA